jgi:N-dimethylarginine dimethylaminohydrolase
VESLKNAFPNHQVRAIRVEEGLHLKSLISALDEDTIVVADTEIGRHIASTIKLQPISYKFLFVPDIVAANVLVSFVSVF